MSSLIRNDTYNPVATIDEWERIVLPGSRSIPDLFLKDMSDLELIFHANFIVYMKHGVLKDEYIRLHIDSLDDEATVVDVIEKFRPELYARYRVFL